VFSEIKSIFQHRELLAQITQREIKSRYKQSVLGYFWVILNPLIQMIVMSFVFSTIMRIPTHANQNIPYIVFLYTAMLPWTLFANTVSSSANSLVSNSSLITKVYFPRSIFPIATLLSKIVDFLFASLILIVFMFIFKIPFTPNALWFIPIFLIQQIFTLGLSFFFAAANLFYRDIQYLLGLVLMLWMYLTPIIYPIEIIPDRYHVFFKLNPMSVLTNAYRQCILGGGAPNLLNLSLTLILSLLTLIFCFRVFKKWEKNFADIV
jgi:lipopolysaccharide transport system permease protein